MKTSKPKLRRWSSGVTVAAAMLVGAIATPDPGFCRDDATASADSTNKVTSSIPASPSTAKKTKLRENSYYYGAFNRRDPFKSLVEGQFIRDSIMEPVELTAVELVGIVRGDLDRFALLEDEKGFTYVLRVGDKVRNGTVVAIGEQTMTARITNFGQTSKYTLHLVERQKGDKR